VGAAQGIRFATPPAWILEEVSLDPLAAICRASLVRYRQVALTGHWWLQDAGPLLAFQGEDRTPVALLPRPLGGYDLLDPGPGARAALLDEARAGTLQPFGYAFYRPAPARQLSTRDLVRLAWPDLRRDLRWILGMALTGSLLGLVMPLITGRVVGQVIPQGDTRSLIVLFLCLVAMAASGTLFELTRGWAMLRLQARSGTSMQAAIMDRVLSLPVRVLRQDGPGRASYWQQFRVEYEPDMN